MDDDEIMVLCARLLVARDVEAVQRLAVELQEAIHTHIERLREKARANRPVSDNSLRVIRLRQTNRKAG